MARAVIVPDMLRGLLEEGYPLYCGAEARNIISNVQRLLERELQQGAKGFYLCDRHRPDDPESRMFPPHCIESAKEAELIPELLSYPGEIIAKTTFSAFYDTLSVKRLKAIKPETVVVCGVTTHICVLQAVTEARNRGHDVEVPVDCVAPFDTRACLMALDYMEKVLGAGPIKPAVEAAPRRLQIPDSWLNGETADIYSPRATSLRE